jgi:hypothetical protein
MFNVTTILKELSGKRPVFRLENDFQEALLQTVTGMGIRCVKDKIVNGTKVDLWLEDGENEILIQLKHKTRELSVTVGGSQFNLKKHGAYDQGRYDFLKDIKSLESLCLDNPYRKGYAILLTNDHRYWEKGIKPGAVDEAFHLYEGRKVCGGLTWKKEASHGTKSGRENAIDLKGIYDLKWNNYSRFVAKDSEFRYLCVEVK